MKSLSEYLSENDVRQDEFARRVGTTQANISKLCGRNPTISAEMAVKIEAATSGQVAVEVWPKFAVLSHRKSYRSPSVQQEKCSDANAA